MEPVKEKTQAVVLRYAEKFGKKSEAIRHFNELLISPVTEATFYNWCNGVYKPMPRVLREAMRVYPAGDWRHEMAAELRGLLTEG